MDLSRILNKLDTLVEGRNYEGAKELLKYWLDDAKKNADEKAALYLYNESMGLYRKAGEKETAVSSAECALHLLERLGMENTITAATTYINAGTVFKAFGDAERGLPLFEKAKEIYESRLGENDTRLGGLYNNMGLVLLDTGKYEEALSSYEKALAVMEKAENGNLERAITYLNMADVYDRMHSNPATTETFSEEEWETIIDNLLTKAWECLEDESLPRDGYYAFVAEKCAPVFDYYGRFMYRLILEERIDAFHAGKEAK